MIALEKYVLEALATYNYVLVSGFGSFLAQNQSSEISPDKDIIYPPSRVLFFYDRQEGDVSLLPGIVAKSENISLMDAYSAIVDAVEEWNLVLKTKKSLALQGLGLFRYNDKGLLEFIFSSGKANEYASGGLSPVELKKEPSLPPIIIDRQANKTTNRANSTFLGTHNSSATNRTIPQNLATKSEAHVEPSTIADNKDLKTTAETDRFKYPTATSGRVATRTNSIDDKLTESRRRLGIDKPQGQVIKTAEPTPAKKPPINTKAEKGGKPKKSSFLWLVVSLIIVLCAGGSVYFFYVKKHKIPWLSKKHEVVDTPKKEAEPVEAPEDTDNIANVDESLPNQDYGKKTTEVKTESASNVGASKPLSTELSPVKTTSGKPNNAIDNKKYYVIAGAFDDELKAKDLLTKVKSRGFKDAYTAFYNKYNLHTVFYNQGFDEKSEAMALLYKINKIDPGAWVIGLKKQQLAK